MAHLPNEPCRTLAEAATVLDLPRGTIGSLAMRGSLEPFMHLGITRLPYGSRTSPRFSRDALCAMAILRAAMPHGIPPELPGIAAQAVVMWKTHRPHVTQLRIAYVDGPNSQTIMLVDEHLMRPGTLPEDWTRMLSFNLNHLFGCVDAALEALDEEAEASNALTVHQPDPAALLRA